MTSSVESSFATATEMFKEVFEQVAKEKQELENEKQKWEKEKMLMDKKFVFNGPRIVLDVGGMHYSASRSTLTKYPESMLGVMFSGRHDLETMQCKDGSFFIDRDGTLDTSSIICGMEKKWLSLSQSHQMFYQSLFVKLNITNSMVLHHCLNLFYKKLMLLNKVKSHHCFYLVRELITLIMMMTVTMEKAPLMLATILRTR